jgi:preprotein translocase subunit Sss1
MDQLEGSTASGITSWRTVRSARVPDYQLEFRNSINMNLLGLIVVGFFTLGCLTSVG